jgi:hypothetical protein
MQFTGQPAPFVILNSQQPSGQFAEALLGSLHLNDLAESGCYGGKDLLEEGIVLNGDPGEEHTDGLDTFPSQDRHTKSGAKAKFTRGMLPIEIQVVLEIA